MQIYARQMCYNTKSLSARYLDIMHKNIVQYNCTTDTAKCFWYWSQEAEGCHCSGLECTTDTGGNISAEFLKPGELICRFVASAGHECLLRRIKPEVALMMWSLLSRPHKYSRAFVIHDSRVVRTLYRSFSSHKLRSRSIYQVGGHWISHPCKPFMVEP